MEAQAVYEHGKEEGCPLSEHVATGGWLRCDLELHRFRQGTARLVKILVLIFN